MSPYQAVLFAFFKRKHHLTSSQIRRIKSEFIAIYNPINKQDFLRDINVLMSKEHSTLVMRLKPVSYIEMSSHD